MPKQKCTLKKLDDLHPWELLRKMPAWGDREQQPNGYNFLFMSSGLEAAESNTNILTINGILGEPVTFPLNIQDIQQVTNINWVSSKTSVAVIMAHSGTHPQVIVTHQNYKQRINVSSQNYNLEISNLRMEDAGIYRADINTKNTEKETITRTYKLQVYRKSWEDKGLVLYFYFANLLLQNNCISDYWVP